MACEEAKVKMLWELGNRITDEDEEDGDEEAIDEEVIKRMKEEDDDRRRTFDIEAKLLDMGKLLVTDAGSFSRRTYIPETKDPKIEIHNNSRKRM